MKERAFHRDSYNPSYGWIIERGDDGIFNAVDYVPESDRHNPDRHAPRPAPIIPTPVITADEIVDRAETRERLTNWRLAVWGCAACLLLVALNQPVHAWLHGHVEFFMGLLAGTLAQSVPWAFDRYRWLKWFSWQ